MPTPEELQSQLQRFENPKGSEDLRSRLQALPPRLAMIGIAFLECLTSRWDDERAPQRQQERRAIEGLDDNSRLQLFGTLFPCIAEHVEASWQLQKKLPYQLGYLRRAFRAPLHSEYTSETRIDWLDSLLRTAVRYHCDREFLTVWGAHLGWGTEHAVGLLLAGLLDSEHPARAQTYNALVRILEGEHEIAAPARYAVTALLSSSRPEGWGVVERLLLAAQRQEGLRQVVLESVDFAHRDAFLRMLQLIVREKLGRFAAVARAVAVWFGLPIDSEQSKLIDSMIIETLEDLEDDKVRADRIDRAEGQTLFLALWAQAFEDVAIATEMAALLALDPSFERRYPAIHLLAQLGTRPAARVLRGSLRDSDLRVAIKAMEIIPAYSRWCVQETDTGDTFEALQSLIARVPADETLQPAVWAWNRIRARHADVASRLIANRGDRPFAELAPYLPAMDADGRRSLLSSIQDAVRKRPTLQADERELAFSLLGDPSNGVRQAAFEILGSATLTGSEAEAIEPLLTRKASDLRRGVIRLLLRQAAADCRLTIERLSSSADPLMKQAAEEIQSELEPKSVPAASLHDGLGLFDPAQRTSPVAPSNVLAGKLSTPSAERLLLSLDGLVDENREASVTVKGYDGSVARELFGNLRWVDPDRDYPLGPVWAAWWEARRREDGADEVELARALCTVVLATNQHEPDWASRTADELAGSAKLKFPYLVRNTLWYLTADTCTIQAAGFLLDAVETYLHRIANNYDPGATEAHYHSSWRTIPLGLLTRVLESCRARHPEHWDVGLWRRYWMLLRWIDEGLPADDRHYPALEITLTAHKLDIATEADVYDQLLGGRGHRGYGLYDLAAVTKRKPHTLVGAFPELAVFAGRCRDRILEVELKRGDLPTAASPAALSLGAVFGAELAVTLLKLLGKDPLSRGYSADNESKSVVLSHLLRVCLPAGRDTADTFAVYARTAGLSRKRLVNLALYAPQWAAYVEQATGLAGLEDVAYWLHAHTKDSQWTVEAEIRELWFAEVSERTPLPRQELLDGAVDVDWFRRVRPRLSAEDWCLILDSAKFASGGGGHKRAQLFAGAIGGEVQAPELAARIQEKRSQDAVRAIGLVPLPPRDPERRRAILSRYEVLQQFLREGRQFGALRQASEKLAYSIGLTNLARVAGYPDPQRLSWAMEAEAIADLKGGPVDVAEGDVRAVLSVNRSGEPELAFEKNGKVLKDLPVSLRKSPVFAALRTRKTMLAQQTSRMRLSLEEAMIRGDRFTIPEVEELADHPLLRPMVAALLFVSENGEVHWHEDLRRGQGTLRIAHPIDLLESGEWAGRQKECLQVERVQPFKQAFRELYILTKAERDLENHSGRYEGSQVNPRQALTVLGKHGWVNVPDEGVRKTFHADNVSAWVTFLEGWFTPADVDGLTVKHVVFTGRSDGKAIPLDKVCPRIFSEAMRDLDLMVSVAHRGGVDPEATASTVEMRTALLRETLNLLKIRNVRFQQQHAFVDGKIGNYNVHLGSGTVHRQPGGSLCIIPVHSQHRGRIFLPFADNDPKTAEIISKVLLLAQDDKLKDPTILEQLR
ncbi:DUF5724 domain-containing protein [uncultured Paludibaculum sp.]|uniref:DUF5724 domain-containing protein n=1 Tax=uncultured Paludibaculum sp. TaxID=1765020 RepID=UPI002AAC3470|nr:DUF5724 domain-containing protein [uncultured Paludibaculum sp.]